MKTFKEYYDSLTEEQKSVIRSEVKWFDENNPDYVKCNKSLDINCNYIKSLETSTIACLYMKEHYPENFIEYVKKITGHSLNTNIIYWGTKEQVLEYFKTSNTIYELSELFATTEDFDNIPWGKMSSDKLKYTVQWRKLVKEEYLKELYKQDLRYANIISVPLNIFDELFFCENGWTKDQKHTMSKRYSKTLTEFITFLKRIVAVDMSYLKEIYYFIEGNLPLANLIYTQRKEDNSGYMFSDNVRKLAIIAYCCCTKNVSKNAAKKIGNTASLLKLYDYDFDTIFDCLYN